MSNKKFLIVGTVSNVEKELKKDFAKVSKALKKLGSIDTFLVESDSVDGTKELLSDERLLDDSFSFESLGSLKDQIPSRTERIRFCRNRYIDYIRKNQEFGGWDFIVVADLDGMNSAISAKKIAASLNKSDSWDACFSNQSLGYYDIYALRAPNWVEIDPFAELMELKEKNPFATTSKITIIGFLRTFQHFDSLRFKAIYSKMRKLKGDLIQVNSAFGGFAIYKQEIFLNLDYAAIDDLSLGKCEHLDLHEKSISFGYKLFIDPKLINSHWNEYNLNKLKIIRFAREFKKYLRRLN